MAEEEFEQKIDNVAVAAGEDQLDAAGKSLTDALQVSFVILKLIMAVLVLLFFVSGVFRIQPNEQALVLRLGNILSEKKTNSKAGNRVRAGRLAP
ncbi:MAG: hypothetical protein ACYS6I_06620 [Planctomycetota bacterium]|jgi:hypothetical protein